MLPRHLSARLASLALLLGVAASNGCAPLTFSNEASIDFTRYPSVTVELAGPDGSQRQADYLEEELREHSGFRRVSRAGRSPPELEEGPPGQRLPADAGLAHLLVEVTLDSLYDISFAEEDDIDVEIRYAATVRYHLSTAEGVLVDSGLDTAASESTALEAAEAALDQVVLRYLRPYRL